MPKVIWTNGMRHNDDAIKRDARSLLVSITYIIVLFSIIVQGLSLERVVKRLK